MGDLLGSLIWGAKSGQYCVIGGGSLHQVSGFSPSNLGEIPVECYMYVLLLFHPIVIFTAIYRIEQL
jgi:hypothetical protein